MTAFATPAAVTVLTGFLGSGKTTLLAALLRQPAMRDSAVLINEVGTVGLDHLLLDHVDDRTVLLASGCVCCSVRSDLAAALARLLLRRDRGEVPGFSRVLVETTGLADPAPVLNTLLSDAMLADRLRLQGVVTTVDALDGAARLASRFEAARQAAVADLLVISKTDLATPAAVAGLECELDRLNPGAARVHAVHGALDAAQVLALGLWDADTRTPDVRRWLHDAALRPVAAPMRVADRHGDAVRRFALELDRPVHRADLEAALELLADLYGDALLRVKGVVDLAGEAPVALHLVGHRRYPFAPLPGWPAHWDGGGTVPGSRRSRLVFVTRQLSRDSVSSLFAHLVAPSFQRD